LLLPFQTESGAIAGSWHLGALKWQTSLMHAGWVDGGSTPENMQLIITAMCGV
jgi:hypothetical protein